jgi:hypothetical protein
MSNEAIWGLVLVLYVVPFWFWQLSEHLLIEARKKLYPGRPDIQNEGRFNKVSFVWILGLFVLLAGWIDQPQQPISVAIATLAIFALGLLIRVAFIRWRHLPMFRFWLAGSLVWGAGVLSWFTILGRVSDLTEYEFYLLAAIPPAFVAFALAAFGWARAKGQNDDAQF